MGGEFGDAQAGGRCGKGAAGFFQTLVTPVTDSPVVANARCSVRNDTLLAGQHRRGEFGVSQAAGGEVPRGLDERGGQSGLHVVEPA